MTVAEKQQITEIIFLAAGSLKTAKLQVLNKNWSNIHDSFTHISYLLLKDSQT